MFFTADSGDKVNIQRETIRWPTESLSSQRSHQKSEWVMAWENSHQCRSNLKSKQTLYFAEARINTTSVLIIHIICIHLLPMTYLKPIQPPPHHFCPFNSFSLLPEHLICHWVGGLRKNKLISQWGFLIPSGLPSALCVCSGYICSSQSPLVPACCICILGV